MVAQEESESVSLVSTQFPLGLSGHFVWLSLTSFPVRNCATVSSGFAGCDETRLNTWFHRYKNFHPSKPSFVMFLAEGIHKTFKAYSPVPRTRPPHVPTAMLQRQDFPLPNT